MRATAAAYLASAVAKDGYLKSALAGAEDQPDHGNTADAVVALAAAGRTAEAGKSLAWLEKNSAAWAAQSGPAAYAQLIFAAHATGTDPRDFGGADLVKQLGATGPEGWSNTAAGPPPPARRRSRTRTTAASASGGSSASASSAASASAS